MLPRCQCVGRRSQDSFVRYSQCGLSQGHGGTTQSQCGRQRTGLSRPVSVAWSVDIWAPRSLSHFTEVWCRCQRQGSFGQDPVISGIGGRTRGRRKTTARTRCRPKYSERGRYDSVALGLTTWKCEGNATASGARRVCTCTGQPWPDTIPGGVQEKERTMRRSRAIIVGPRSRKRKNVAPAIPARLASLSPHTFQKIVCLLLSKRHPRSADNFCLMQPNSTQMAAVVGTW